MPFIGGLSFLSPTSTVLCMAMNDIDLDELIRGSTPKPDFQPAFQREIWARIAIAERARKNTPMEWLEAALRFLSRPAPALATAAVMLLLGVGLRRSVPVSTDEGFSRQAYLAAINPLAPHGDDVGE